MLARLQKLNPQLKIKSVESLEFNRFGRILTEYDFTGLIELMENMPVPSTTNTYVAEVPETRTLPIYAALERNLYGEMPIQIGFGGGFNLALNALEWHRGSEVNVAISDFVVMLAQVQDMKEGKLDSGLVETFYLEKGQAIEIYGTTLHYSPCNVDSHVFRMVVVLPKGTNLSLESAHTNDPLIAAKNKWLIAHPDASKEVKAGAYVGITGSNLTLKV